MAFTLPAPTLHPAGPAGYSAPASVGEPTFSGTATGTSVFAEACNCVFPGETFVAFGGFDTTGIGTKLVVWAGNNTTQIAARQHDATMFITYLPDSWNWRGVIWVWPRDSAGNYGEPWRLNGPENVRCDTREVVDGDTGRQVRIFGKNLHTPGYTPIVVVEPNGGGTDTELTVTVVDDDHLLVDIPDSLAVGDYDLWVHNGTGGAYGWGLSVDLFSVISSFTALGADVDITASAVNQSTFQTALTTIAGQAGGGRILLAAGTYTIDEDLTIATDRPVQLVGQGAETWDPDTATFSSTGGTVIQFELKGTEGNVGLLFRADRWKLQDLSARFKSHAGAPDVCLVACGGAYGSIDDCVLVGDYNSGQMNLVGAGKQGAFTVDNAAYESYDCEINNTPMYSSFRAILIGGFASYWRFTDSPIYIGYNGSEGDTQGNAVADPGANHFTFRNCPARPIDRSGGEILNRLFFINDCRCQWHTFVNCDVIGHGGDATTPLQPNQYEAYLYHFDEANPIKLGVTSAGASDIIVDAEPTNLASEDSEDKLREYIIFVSGGTGVGQWRTITAMSTTTATNDTLTVDTAWRIQPDNTSTVQIFRSIRHNIILDANIDPTDDGTYADDTSLRYVGVGLWFSCFDNYTRGVEVNNVSTGLYVIGAEDAQTTGLAPSGWNDFRHCGVRDMYTYVGIDMDHIALQVSVHATSQAQVDGLATLVCVGNTFRQCLVQNPVKEALLMGWHRPDAIDALNPGYTSGAITQGMNLNVIELTDIENGTIELVASPPSNWNVVRRNTSNTTLSSNDLKNTGEMFDNIFDDTAVRESNVSTTELWNQYVDNLEGVIHHWKGGSFVDRIAGATVGNVGGITVVNDPPFKDQPQGQALQGSSTADTSISGDLNFANSHWQDDDVTVYWWFKSDGFVDIESVTFWCMGDATAPTTRSQIQVIKFKPSQPSLENMLSCQTTGSNSSMVDLTGYDDGNWHQLALRVNKIPTQIPQFSVDGGGFTGSTAVAINSTTMTTHGMRFFEDINGNQEGDGLIMGDVIVCNAYHSDADAAAIYQKSLVAGFATTRRARNIWTLRPHWDARA